MVKKLTGTILQTAAITLGISLVLAVIWGTINHFNPTTGEYFDGFGRKLYFRSMGGLGEYMLPGFIWEIIDTGIAILSIWLVFTLFSIGAKLKKAQRSQY